MALKATIFKARVQIADMDRNVYAEHALTLARHPSETDERLMVRLLAFALHVPADDHDGALEFGRGLSDADEPDLWQRDLTGAVTHWIEIGQPDERAILRAAGRAARLTVLAYGQSAPIWWQGLADRLARTRNVEVWRLPAAQAQELAGLAQRSMQLQATIQDGHVWLGDGQQAVELTPERLHPR